MTKSVISLSDTPNGQQCGLHDNDDNGMRNVESSAVQGAFVRDDTPGEQKHIALACLGIGLGFYLSLFT